MYTFIVYTTPKSVIFQNHILINEAIVREIPKGQEQKCTAQAVHTETHTWSCKTFNQGEKLRQAAAAATAAARRD